MGALDLSEESRVTMIRAELAASIELQKPTAESVDLLINLREALWDYEQATGKDHEVEDEFHFLEGAIFPDAQRSCRKNSINFPKRHTNAFK